MSKILTAFRGNIQKLFKDSGIDNVYFKNGRHVKDSGVPLGHSKAVNGYKRCRALVVTLTLESIEETVKKYNAEFEVEELHKQDGAVAPP